MLAVFVEDRVGVLDLGPGVDADARDGLADRLVLPGGDREARALAQRGSDDVVAVVGRVGPQHQHPGRAGLLGGDQGVGDEPVGAAGRVRPAPSQPSCCDHRRAAWCGHDRQQCVQAFHAGVATTGALLGVAVGLLEGVGTPSTGSCAGSTRPAGRLRAAPRVIKRKMPKWHVKRAHHASWPRPQHPPNYRIART